MLKDDDRLAFNPVRKLNWASNSDPRQPEHGLIVRNNNILYPKVAGNFIIISIIIMTLQSQNIRYYSREIITISMDELYGV